MVLIVEWQWLVPDQETARPLRCRENDCYYHDGRECRYPWIDRPTASRLDRGLCTNFLIEEDGTWHGRIHAIH